MSSEETIQSEENVQDQSSLDTETLIKEVAELKKVLKKQGTVLSLIKENQETPVVAKPAVPEKTDFDIFKEYIEELKQDKNLFSQENISDFMWEENSLKLSLAYEADDVDEYGGTLEDLYASWKNDKRWLKYLKTKK